MKQRKHVLEGLDDDIREHLARSIEENIERGMTESEARTAALRKFGNPALVREDTREVWVRRRAEQLLQDIRFGLRMLRKSPGMTAIALLVLALSVGGSTAVFSLVDAVLLKPLDYPQADRIMFPWRLPRAGTGLNFDKYPWGRVDFQYFSSQSKTFQALGAFQSDSFNLTGAGEPVRLDGLRASAGFFPSLGVTPALGRTFTDEEDRPGNEHEVILGDYVWRERFGADRSVIGRAIELNGSSYTVIGVMPRGFSFPHGNEMPHSFTFAPEVQLWVPLALVRGGLIPNESDELAVVGRVKEGVTLAEAQAEMTILGKRLEEQRRNGAGWFHIEATPLGRQVAGDTRRPLLMVLAAMAIVLLIACADVASLLLTRAINRKTELTLRMSLGAGSGRLLRQLLTEGLVLASLGGLMGIGVAKIVIYGVKHFGPSTIPRLPEASLDLRVLLFALGTTLLTGVLFSLAPIATALRRNLAESLNEGSRRTSLSSAAQKTRNVLLISQIALALVLVVTAGLLLQTFYRLLRVDPGFRPSHVLTFELSLPAAKYPDQLRIVAVYQEALRKLRSLPGVQASGMTEMVPMGGATEATAIRTPEHPRTPGSPILSSNYTMVTPGYFSAVGTPLLRGREFTESDTTDSMPVTIINSTMARKFWPGQDALGKQVAPAGAVFPLATIVGITEDVKRLSLREVPPPEMFVPFTQKVWPSLLTMNVVIRTSQDPVSLVASAREAIHSVDPDVPLARVRTLNEIVDDSMAPSRFAVITLGAFGCLAIFLAAFGMYGVISYNVSQRTPEIGIRMALGARRFDVFRMVIGQGARITALGVGLGLVASFAVTRLIGNFLFGVRPADPSTFAAVTVLLVSIGLLACYIPARRATQVEPTVALRYE